MVSVGLAGRRHRHHLQPGPDHAARPGAARDARPGGRHQLRGHRVTAGNHDFSAQLDGRAPLVFLFVLGLAFLLLMMTFRSITIPAMSIALNLLSIGAAYGVLTLVFQHGYLHGPLGFSPYGGIVPWMPLFMFVILFGLSMDYHVFILSRIRELRPRGRPPRRRSSAGSARARAW